MVSDVSFTIAAGQTLGLVGESGCGKSLTAMAIVDLLPKPQVYQSGGEISFNGQRIDSNDPKALKALRGKKVAVIFQDPMTALNPVQRTGQQIEEVLKLHFPKMDKSQRRQRSIQLLNDVGIPSPENRIDAYPHQFSGGMRQRLMIAMALAGEPDLLIADEPTTALDVTIQAQIVALLKKLQQERNMAMLFITHDLALVSQVSDHVVVMYAGKIVEQQDVPHIFSQPRHPYTKGLIAALPAAVARAPKTKLDAMPGQVPSIDAMPTGCRFANRCEYANERCEQEAPELTAHETGEISCHHWQTINEASTSGVSKNV
ncbi:ABC transporter ATP-binding protein [Spongiibacter sp. KMU-158]|uniref:ABC-type dipeptide transporter n=2 Tax=Spongiibacter pelagi TaxID=2760804 RepID=A0A927C4K6_9GAMM|nr:ABC transporter ATP-binding protein [Spongiibacter pelagi]